MFNSRKKDTPVILQRKHKENHFARVLAAIPFLILLAVIFAASVVCLAFSDRYYTYFQTNDNNYYLTTGWLRYTSTNESSGSVLLNASFIMFVIGWLVFAASLASLVLSLLVAVVLITGHAGIHTFLLCLFMGVSMLMSFIIYYVAALIEFQKFTGRTTNNQYTVLPHAIWVIGIITALLWLIEAAIASCIAKRARGRETVLVQQGNKVFEVPLTKTGQLPPSLAAQHPVDLEAQHPPRGSQPGSPVGTYDDPKHHHHHPDKHDRHAAEAGLAAGTAGAAVAPKKHGWFGSKKHTDPVPETTEPTYGTQTPGPDSNLAAARTENQAPVNTVTDRAIPQETTREKHFEGAAPLAEGGAAGALGGAALAHHEKKVHEKEGKTGGGLGGLFGRKKHTDDVTPVTAPPPAGREAPIGAAPTGPATAPTGAVSDVPTTTTSRDVDRASPLGATPRGTPYSYPDTPVNPAGQTTGQTTNEPNRAAPLAAGAGMGAAAAAAAPHEKKKTGGFFGGRSKDPAPATIAPEDIAPTATAAAPVTQAPRGLQDDTPSPVTTTRDAMPQGTRDAAPVGIMGSQTRGPTDSYNPDAPPGKLLSHRPTAGAFGEPAGDGEQRLLSHRPTAGAFDPAGERDTNPFTTKDRASLDDTAPSGARPLSGEAPSAPGGPYEGAYGNPAGDATRPRSLYDDMPYEKNDAPKSKRNVPAVPFPEAVGLAGEEQPQQAEAGHKRFFPRKPKDAQV